MNYDIDYIAISLILGLRQFSTGVSRRARADMAYRYILDDDERR